MGYKRLTKYNENTHDAEVYAYTVGNTDVYFDGIEIVGNENSSLAQEIIDRLAELEDKIENGTLIELPCKVGDKVYIATKLWDIKEVVEAEVACVEVTADEKGSKETAKKIIYDFDKNTDGRYRDYVWFQKLAKQFGVEIKE